MKMKLKIGQAVAEVEISQNGDLLTVVHEGQTYQARLVAQAEGVVTLEMVDDAGRRWQSAGIFLDKQQRQLWYDGQITTYERVPERAAAESQHDASLAAAIPAVVTAVLVEPGQHVAANEKLILLESMKMVIPIQAPYAGTVRAIHCQAGAAVQPGVQLVEIEADE